MSANSFNPNRILYFVIVLFTGCLASAPINNGTPIGDHTKLDPDLIDFLMSYERSVLRKSPGNLLPFIDQAYYREQLHFLQGDKKQFLQEWFCGTTLSEDIHSCVRQKDVLKITLSDLVPIDINMYEAYYTIQTRKVMIQVHWTVTYNLENPYKYGFIGSMG